MKSLNNTELSSVLDLLAKRPDLSISQVESLHANLQRQAQQEKKKTAVKWRKIWRHIGISVAIISVALFGYWLSGMPFQRGAPITLLFMVTMLALLVANAIAAISD